MQENFQKRIDRARTLIDRAEYILIGGGAGLSAAAGLTYSGERFSANFADFIGRYGMSDMYSAAFYPFKTPEEKWAYWSRHIDLNRYLPPALPLYMRLHALVQAKDYMEVHIHKDMYFVQDGAWHAAARRYEGFCEKARGKKAVLLELGVSYNTPTIVRFPFERMVYENESAFIVRVNREYPEALPENAAKTLSFGEDAAAVLHEL